MVSGAVTVTTAVPLASTMAVRTIEVEVATAGAEALPGVFRRLNVLSGETAQPLLRLGLEPRVVI